ncbi:MAG: flagellar export chaperone FliS [Veillonellaceae bacterium]|nr:flagellar export chaperone FliS [Veillonellaceae bacterium]
MNTAESAMAYKRQQVMTASPAELTLMLYNGAIRFINESIMALESGDMTKCNNSNVKAQNIVHEFMATLDMQYEISQNWAALYEYIHYRLVQANLKKDRAMLVEARELLTELRDAWHQAMKAVRMPEAVGK